MPDQTRRTFLARAGLLGCSLAASPLITPVSFAAAPWDTRLVVIVLRGGMDGLDVVQPYGDPGWPGLRPSLRGGPRDGSIDLDGFFALHPALAPLLPLWREGHLGFVHAVSTPYRDKRSHFDGQDILEAGTDGLLGGFRTGWLNRMLAAVPGIDAETTYAIGRGDMKLLTGPSPVANWSPDADLSLSPQALDLMELIMAKDAALAAALDEARLLSDDAAQMSGGAGGGGAHQDVAAFAAAKLSGTARIAAFSLNGWDTHRGQKRGIGRALARFSESLLALRGGMPARVWDKTAIIAMTEFGRTARENGTGGTDHGTGGLMILAGGAVRGGKVYGDWPGLGSGDLFEDRDLRPTRDVRAHAAWIMRGLTGLDRSTLEGSVFPNLDMGSDPGLLS